MGLKSLFKRPYKWTLEEDFTIMLPCALTIPNFENEWCIIKNNTLTIKSGYSWDGCSPKRTLFGKLVGTWDGNILEETEKQELYYPSLVHDVLCQFKIGKRKVNDQIFHWMMAKVDFELKELYYRAVRVFGCLFDRR